MNSTSQKGGTGGSSHFHYLNKILYLHMYIIVDT